MDIQFILDPFACAVYIVDYINKADRGMSRLLREALHEARKGNKSIKESLRSVSNVFLNSSEISAQEAIYVLAGLPLSRASEAEIYINTSLPQERVHILKSHSELQGLAPDSTDIFQKSLIDYYSKRPVSLEHSVFQNSQLFTRFLKINPDQQLHQYNLLMIFLREIIIH